MVKQISIALLLGVTTAAPSGLLLNRIAPFAPIAYAPAPITYAEPTTLTKYESISSPLTYTASHQPAIALTNAAPVQLTYGTYPVI